MAEVGLIPGFVWGVVIDDKDPLGIGRVKFTVPGMFEPNHPEWAMPLAWPGAGLPSQGSKYSTKIGAQIAIIFERGDPDATPAYFTAPYGASTGIPDGPSVTTEAFLQGLAGSELSQEVLQQAVREGRISGLATGEAAEEVLEVNVIWEDEAFAFFVITKKTDRRVVLVEKKTYSGFVLNATDGGQSKSVSIELFANTSIKIGSKGIIDIAAQAVQIQGRKVVKKPGVTTI